MRLEPKDLFEKLEFDKIIELLVKECLGEQGIERIRALQPQTNLIQIEERLKEVTELKRSIEHNDRLPLLAYENIDSDLQLLAIVDAVLPEDGLRRINTILVSIGNIYKFFTPSRREFYKTLYEVVRPVHFDPALAKEIDRVIDPDGNIRPDASPELLRIHKLTQSKMKELDRVFRDIINDYRAKGWLSDSVESFRNGRRVLSVPAEHKRKIRGIIHDESATGKTAFIEPEAVIEINNDIFDLEQQERREIYRILKELSTILRPYVPQLHQYQEIMVYFDVVQAKARLAVRMKAIAPLMLDTSSLEIYEGYHPLLLLKNSGSGKKTVPFDLRLDGGNRILVLSGPNAGGKSITMKSTGLLQLMAQSGLLIPVNKRTELGIFHNFFADIGDQQSIEDDLSTYSSRLANMRLFLEHANERTLVLIDEFGSGTDPQIGGAIAEAILWELNYRKSFGVITTHYSNLKIFAYKSKGILNGSMVFDKENLAPTYELKVGRPGSSYAFEIAEKSGLGGKVLDYAKNRVGKNEKAVDQLLIDLQREKQEVEEELKGLKDRQEKLDKLMKSYDSMQRDLDFRRKRMKLEAKEQDLQKTSQDNKDLDKLVRDLREARNLEQAMEAAAKAREEKKKLVEQVTQLREEVYHSPESRPKNERPITKGDFVKLVAGGATGKVESIKGDKVVVEVGLMRMTLNIRDLQLSNPTLDLRQTKSVQSDVVQRSAAFYPRIDIRGVRYEEALKMVEDFMDQALITSSNHLQIVHGKGNGTLRNAVRSKLKEYQNVEMEIRHPEQEGGGDGVTLIEFK
ncbi:MAG: Smr/MutS family protein [Haliscomenobacter sp.]|nr:Smr/MutS family protein [Haliscomenobacter sp.]MBK9490737.1 Smr/MutS family protein [Haliscomenobacter sp.]HPH19470.1 Smr/MutS family protein [Haliscomenobacter sp.]